LSVESDLVRCSILSLADGREVATSCRSLELLMGTPDGNCRSTSDRCTEREEEEEEEEDDDDNNNDDDGCKDDDDDDCVTTKAVLDRGWVEQIPDRIWEAVGQVIEACLNEMTWVGLPISCVKSVGITNEPGTVMSWNADTGKALHNAIHWTDERMKCNADDVGGTGAAVEWLMRRAPNAKRYAADKCRFGTLDAWLLWMLTDGRTYVTDVTNASYTGLFNLATFDWNRDVCRERGLSDGSWPSVCSSDVVYDNDRVVVSVGRLSGVPVTVIMARPGATLYGQGCYRSGQAVVTVAARHVTVLGSYKSRRDQPPPARTRTGPLPVVGYCEPNPSNRTRRNVVFGVFVTSNAPAVITWLVNNTSLGSSPVKCMNAYASARPTSKVPFIVPAMNGLPSAPYCRPDARLIVCGITDKMGPLHLITAAVDSVCHSVADLAKCVASGSAIKSVDALFVDGAYSVYGEMLQQLANVSGHRVFMNQDDMAVRGVARMAAAEMDTVYGDELETTVYEPRLTVERRAELAKQWSKAVRNSYGWVETDGGIGSNEFVAQTQRTLPTVFSYAYVTELIKNVGHALRDFVFWKRAG